MSNNRHQEDYNYSEMETAFKFQCGILLFLVFICFIVLPVSSLFNNSNNFEKVYDVTATVIDKKYRVNDSYYMIGSTIGIEQEEEYLLTLKYDEVHTVIRNQTLYKALDIGSTINADLYVYYDKDGNITSKKLVIKEE